MVFLGKINIYIILLRAYAVRGFDMVFNNARFFVGTVLSCALLPARFCLRAFVLRAFVLRAFVTVPLFLWKIKVKFKLNFEKI